jgi:hypothetical protein
MLSSLVFNESSSFHNHCAFILTKGGPNSQKVYYLPGRSQKTKKQKIPNG